jgi:hypothetical protein
MQPGRRLAGALLIAFQLTFVLAFAFADREPRAASAKVEEARASARSLSSMAALLAAGFVPAIFMIARRRERKGG